MNSPFKHLSLIWILLSTLFFTMAAAGYTDAVLLFGDSLTQAWSEGSLAQRLSEYWLRRLDVVNRGYGGYNSEWGIPSFEVIFGTKEDREAGRAQEVQLLTIWFGTNDAVLPGRLQYTPIPRFQENLKTLVDYVRNKDSKWYSPNTRIVFINPPPFIAADRLATQYTRWRDEYKCEGPEPVLDREWDNTKKYAEAVVELGKEINVPTIDLWTKIIEAAGGESPEHLKPYFYDGLHFNSLGYKVLTDELTSMVTEHWPELHPEAIRMRLPHFADIDPENPRATIPGQKPVIPRPHDEL
ncbi:uncharacterized protein EHS24_005990 [Apiotrichum porosum]|uniref:SGNH hydrolase-type esterase domain-containing protein n=1 Tax=Apiotrichum porosum TaxID=105984 RepID=A0A427Y047_9TREE|nr:uncharacterized protein EHS24_005990 [Apiotrichum porosum]RSH84469.1 hypothetical protein EHS24_005990 [Apiotrichum porosum]